jgi:glycerophosphoryl diester phosphodiesterase
MRKRKYKTKEIQKIIHHQQMAHAVVFIGLALLILLGIIGHRTYIQKRDHILRQKAAKKESAASRGKSAKLRPWYSYHAVSHALGGLDGKDYLNSSDGFYAAYKKGYRVFEMDLLRTTDHVMIGKHHWGETLSDPRSKHGVPVNFGTFKSTKIYGRYTPTSFLDMLNLMEKYPDIYLMTDSKGDKIEEVKKDFHTIVDTAKQNGKKDVLDRLVIQVYNREMYYAIKAIHPFRHFVYTTYKQRDAAFYSMVKFCKRYGIEAVTSPQNDINDYRMNILKKEGIYSYTHSVNNPYYAMEYMKLGVYGIYSDFLTPDEINFAWIRANYSKQMSRVIQYFAVPYRNL